MSDTVVPGGDANEGKPEAGPYFTGARGVQVGDRNFQANYFYHPDGLTATDGVGKPPLVTGSGKVESPYRGLGHFDERDAPYFHGREAATREVLAAMDTAVRGSGLLVVSGVSGAGKSSLLRAGVLPRIRGEGLPSVPGAARWLGLVLTPTRDPLEQLALRAAHLLGTDAVRMRENLRGDPSSFALSARQLALRSAPDRAGNGRLLVIVDQFEQVFTQCADQELRRKFAAALASAARSGVALVVLVVRADFDARCADFPELTAAVKDRCLVTAMDELQLREAITRPVATLAASSGRALSVDAPLVDFLVMEMLEAPAGADPAASGAGALPLLSHALDQAWRHRLGPVLTLDDYARGGRIQGAVAASAERAFESLTPPAREAARQVFLRLTTADDDGTPTRDRVPRDELLAVAGPGQRDDVAAVLDAFTRERLVTQAADSVEISHDALLSAWPLLRDDWLAEGRADLAIRSRLRGAAREWGAHGRKPGSLYRDEVLDEALGAADRIAAAPGRQPGLSPGEDEFLRASTRARQKAARARSTVRRGFYALTIGLAVAVVIASIELNTSNRALNMANVQQMSAQSVALRQTNPAVSELAAAAAWRAAPSQETRDLAIEAAANPLIGQFDAQAGTDAVSPDGSLLAVGDGTGVQVSGGNDDVAITLWSVTERKILGYIPLGGVGSDAAGFSVAFSPVTDGHVQTLAVSTATGVKLYRISGLSHQLEQTLPVGVTHGLPVAVVSDPVAFRADGMLAVAATGSGGDIELFADVNGHYSDAPRYVIRNQDPVTSLSFGPDESLAVATQNATAAQDAVKVYPPANGYTGQPVTARLPAATANDSQFNGPDNVQFNAAGLLAISTPTGMLVDSYARDKLTRVPEVDVLPQTGGGTTAMALSNKGVLAVAESDGLHLQVTGKNPNTTGFIDVTTVPYPGQEPPTDVAFSPDGQTLIENFYGTVYVYSTQVLIGTLQVVEPSPTSAQNFTVIGFDPSDDAILAMGTLSAVDLINVTDGKAIPVPGTADAMSAAFAPNGALAVAVRSGVLVFPHPLTSGQHSLVPGTAGINSVAFGPAGALAVAVIGSSSARLTVYPPGKFSSASAIRPHLTGAPSAGSLQDLTFGPRGQLAVAVEANDNGQLDTVDIVVLAPGTYTEQGLIKDSPALAATSVNGEALAFAPDGTLAVGRIAGIDLYAPGTFRDPRTIAGVGSVNNPGNAWLTFSPGGLLLSVDTLTGMSVWDDATGQGLATVDPTPDVSLQQLAVSQDGKYIAYESAADGSVGSSYVTLVRPAQYLDGNVTDGVRFLCGQLGATPGTAQWGQYFTSGPAYPSVCG